MRAKINSIVNDFFVDRNPTFWAGKGLYPSCFDESPWEYELSKELKLRLSVCVDNVRTFHRCTIVNSKSNTEILFNWGIGIDSALNMADTIFNLCKEYERKYNEKLFDGAREVLPKESKFPALTKEAVQKAQQVLADSGIESEETGIVLQALGYVLLDEELEDLIDWEFRGRQEPEK